jgi:uncharacterized protein
MSASAFIRAACKAAVDSLEQNDAAFRAYMAMLDERERVAARDAEHPERVAVSA